MSKKKFDRINLIQTFIKKLDAEVYLEIGVCEGHAFFRVKCKRKIAVDPKFRLKNRQKIKRWIRNLGNQYHEMTSDEFFQNHKDQLVSAPPKVVFIDGLHTFEQTLQDCYNSLNYLAEGGVIILHDCSPPTEASSTIGMSGSDAEYKWLSSGGDSSAWDGSWCGDTWKTIPYLLKNHPELNACVLNTDFGLGVVSKKKNTPPEFQYGTPSHLTEFSAMRYAELEQNRKSILNLKELSELNELIACHS